MAPSDTDVLEAIAESIRTRDEHLSEIRLREKRTSLLFSLYSVGAWGLYLAAWFASMLPSLEGRQTLWNWRIPKSVEKEDPNGNLRQRAITMNPSPRAPARQLNQRAQPTFDPRSPPRLQVPGVPGVPAPTPPRPVQPPQRGWLDRVADKVLGEDESSLGVAQSRYALICERCFSHNGLVKEGDWETTQYICPKCGHMNISPKAKKTGMTPYFLSPATPIAGPMSAMPSSAIPSRASHSPVPDSSEPPSQDHPSQDQPVPDDIKEEMEVDSS
ncbi:hypothetical protein FRC11_011439 [Ceratobasidium sp. 423]|nr:hypothetical protein FRC11_011439 [Ceratobasidium sp. 423]